MMRPACSGRRPASKVYSKMVDVAEVAQQLLREIGISLRPEWIASVSAAQSMVPDHRCRSREQVEANVYAHVLACDFRQAGLGWLPDDVKVLPTSDLRYFQEK